VLAGGALPSDREVVVYDEYGPVRMVRTRDWKYVHRHPDGPHELFDLNADPDERHNRIDDPGVHNIAAALRSRLARWFASYVDPRRDGLDKGITGCGQLGLAEKSAPGNPMFADSHLNNADWDLWLTNSENSWPDAEAKAASN
jgi:arylsulfatase A-like enzyme